MVTRTFVVLVVAVVTLAAAGCDSENAGTDLVPMPTGNADLRQRLLAELDRRKIWYGVLDDARIEIEIDNVAVVGELFDSMIQNALPRDRSFSPAPEALNELVVSLRDQGITCDSVHAFETEWLVCSSEDMQVVNETLERIVIGENAEVANGF